MRIEIKKPWLCLLWFLLVAFMSISAYGSGERYGVWLPWMLMFVWAIDETILSEKDKTIALYRGLVDRWMEILERKAQ